MASGLYTGTDVILQDEENAIWALEKADFPITLYERPGLAISNLLLRGDVDAATRAIFSPQTLTPAEMKTFSGELVGDGKNPLLKTVADVVTNPLVLLGVVMALKYPIGGKSNAIFEIGQGLAKGKPGPLMSKVQSAFNGLRNVPHAFRSLLGMAKDTGNMVDDYGRAFNGIVNKHVAKSGKRLTESDWLKVSADIQGLNVATKSRMVEGKKVSEAARGVRKYWNQVMGNKEPMWPGLRGQMSPELRRMSDDIKGWFTKLHGNFTKNPKAWKAFQKEMGAKGVDVKLGDFMSYYLPIQARYSSLEGVAVKNLLGPSGYHNILGKATGYVAGALKPAMGVTIGDITQLRKMEKLGMRPVVDNILSFVKKDSTQMENFLHTAWNGVRGMTNQTRKYEEFAKRVIEKATKNKMNTRLRLGPGKLADEALRQVAEQLDSVSMHPQRFKDKVAGIADVLMRPASYDMRPVQASRRYLTQMASSWSYHMAPVVHPGTSVASRGWKSVINPIINSTKGKPGFQYAYMKDQLLPMLRGLKPHNAYARASMMGEYKDKVGMWLATHPMAQRIPEGSRNYLMKHFGNFSNLSSESIGAKISEFFYVSTLGLNISPASKNLLQNYITLLHMPGINKAGLRAGMGEMMGGIKKYRSLIGTGMNKEEAFNTAFKTYVQAVGKASGITHAMKMGDIGAQGLAGKISGGGVWDKAKDIMLTPFAASETFNRLFGFYVAKNSYLTTHGTKAMAQAIEFGGMANHLAHFPGGPLGMPRALLGTWGPLRQFMHFPLRYAGFLGASTQWGGQGLAKYRTLATTAGASAGAYTVAKNLLGVDISQGLMYGALPFPQYEKSPFYPWPLVPPIAAVGGEVARAVGTGEAGSLTRTAALLAPGGIALRRLYKTLGPKYADYKNPTEDGRVPVYNDSKALIGAYTPWQLTMKSIGLAPTDQQAEYGAAKWLLTQREKIRGFRRDYLEALADNDVRKSEKINREFVKAYPELGPLQIKKSDITAIHNRRETSRLQRILKGFSSAYQPLFGHMISQVGLAGVTQQLESRPTAIDEYLPLTTQ